MFALPASRHGLGILVGFLIAIPPTLLAFSLRAGWDPVRVVDGGLADSLHGMVMHESWAVAALKAVAIAFHPWVFPGRLKRPGNPGGS